MVRRIGLGVCVFMLAGCPNGEVSSGAGAPVTSGVTEQPTVWFRCEEGRLGAYVVRGDFEDRPAEHQMVPISLDSAPDC